MISYVKKIGLLLFALSSCGRWSEPPQYTQYRPVLLSRESLENQFLFIRLIKSVLRQKFITKTITFLSASILKGYISQITAILQNRLTKVIFRFQDALIWLDNATYLVAINLNCLSSSQVEVTKRIKNAFPELAPPDGRTIPEKYEVQNRRPIL